MSEISKAMPKPLPCPFCGSSLVSDCYVRDGRQMVCHRCGVSGPPTFHGPAGDTIERAVSAWNTRAVNRDHLFEEMVEALAEAAGWLESVEDDGCYQFDNDFTLESERLVPRLKAILAKVQQP